MAIAVASVSGASVPLTHDWLAAVLLAVNFRRK